MGALDFLSIPGGKTDPFGACRNIILTSSYLDAAASLAVRRALDACFATPFSWGQTISLSRPLSARGINALFWRLPPGFLTR
jgi:hypothetical protein